MSSTDTNKLRARVATLDKLLDDFDGQLDDLLAKSLPETLLGLDTLQQAKLQVTIPYLVYDLVIIYLKTKGIDPKTHPVFRELERVKGYIEKVSKAEKQESEQQRMAIDKVAANRFIKHAIAQAVRSQGQSSEPADEGPTPGPSKIQEQPVPTGATNKILARTEWEKQVQEAAEEEEEVLEIFEETQDRANVDGDVEMTGEKAPESPSPLVRTGEADTQSEQQSATTKKRKKKAKKIKHPPTGSTDATTAMDTNAGTGGADVSSNPQVPTTADPSPEVPSSANMNSKKRPFPLPEIPTGDSEDPTPAPTSAPKKKRNRNKKNQNKEAETDGTASRSHSQSQSRDVSVTSTPQVVAQPLPGVEMETGLTGTTEKPGERKKYSRKKKNANV